MEDAQETDCMISKIGNEEVSASEQGPLSPILSFRRIDNVFIQNPILESSDTLITFPKNFPTLLKKDCKTVEYSDFVEDEFFKDEVDFQIGSNQGKELSETLSVSRSQTLSSDQQTLLQSRQNSIHLGETDNEDSLYNLPDTISNTESFSELRFSVSETHSEINFSESENETSSEIATPISKETELFNVFDQFHNRCDCQKKMLDDTSGILYEMSKQLNKVPQMMSEFNKQISTPELLVLPEPEVEKSSSSRTDPGDTLEERVLQYFSQCDKVPLTGKENSKGQEELEKLEAAVERMLTQVEIQEILLKEDLNFVPLVLDKKEVKALPLLVHTLCLSPEVRRRKIHVPPLTDRHENEKLVFSTPQSLQISSLFGNVNESPKLKDKPYSLFELEKSVNRLLNEVEMEEKKLHTSSPESRETYTSTNSTTDISSEDDSFGVWWEGAYRSLPRHSARKRLTKTLINSPKMLKPPQTSNFLQSCTSDDSDTSKESVQYYDKNKKSHSKLVVRTTESGKSALEIRTCNEFTGNSQEGGDSKFCKSFRKTHSDAHSTWNRSLPSLCHSPPILPTFLPRSLGSDDSINYMKYLEPSDCIQYFTPCPTMDLDSTGYCTWRCGGSSSVGKEKIQTHLEECKTNIFVPHKDPEQINETIDIEIKKHFKEVDPEKDLKYQFTMSTPDKKTFYETLNSLTSFLESEKAYSDEMKPRRLTVVADAEAMSSDDTEGSQSRSESEPKSEKSFMGKMSKKLLKVFKKDDKDKSGKKKGKKKKHKNEVDDNVKAVRDDIKPAIIIDEVEPANEIKHKLISGIDVTVEEGDKVKKMGKPISVDVPSVTFKLDENDTEQHKEGKVLPNNKETNWENINIPVDADAVTSNNESIKYVNIQTTSIVNEVDDVAGPLMSEKLSKDNKFQEENVGIVEDKKHETEVDISLKENNIFNKPITNTEPVKNFQKKETTSLDIANQSKEKTNAEINVNVESIQPGNKESNVNESKTMFTQDEPTRMSEKNELNDIFSVQVMQLSKEETSRTIADNLKKTLAKSSDEMLCKVITETDFKPVPEQILDSESAERFSTEDSDKLREIISHTTVAITENIDKKIKKVDDEVNIHLSETKKLVADSGKSLEENLKDATKEKKTKTKKFFGGLFSRSSEESDTSKSKIIEPELGSPKEVKVINKAEVNIPEIETKVSEILNSVDMSIEAVDSTPEGSKLKQNVSGTDKSQVSSEKKPMEKEVVKFEYEADSTKENMLIQTENENSKSSVETSKTNVGKGKGSKEKSKSFFGGIFSKTEEIVQDGKTKVNDPFGTVSEKTVEVKDKNNLILSSKNIISESADEIINKSRTSSHPISKTLADTDSKVTESEKVTRENNKSVTENIENTTGNARGEDEYKAIEISSKVTDDKIKSKKKTKLIFGKGKVNDKVTTMSEKTLISTQSCDENLLADSKNKKEKLIEKCASTFEIINKTSESQDLTSVEACLGGSEEIGLKDQSIDKETEKPINFSNNSASETVSMITESAKKPKENSKSLFGGIFNKAGDKLKDTTEKLSDSKINLVDLAKETKDGTIKTKNIVLSETKHEIKVGEDFDVEKEKSLNVVLRDLKDKGLVAADHEIEKVKEVTEDSKNKATDKVKSLANDAENEAVSIQVKVCEKSVKFADMAQEKLDSSKNTLSESINDSTDKATSFFGSILRKTEQMPHSSPDSLEEDKNPVIGTFTSTEEYRKENEKDVSITKKIECDRETELQLSYDENVASVDVHLTGDMPSRSKKISKEKNEQTKTFFGSLFSKADKTINENKDKVESARESVFKESENIKSKAILSTEYQIGKTEETVKVVKTSFDNSTQHVLKTASDSKYKSGTTTKPFTSEIIQVIDRNVHEAALDSETTSILAENIKQIPKTTAAEVKEIILDQGSNLQTEIETKGSTIYSNILDELKKDESKKDNLKKNISEQSETKIEELSDLVAKCDENIKRSIEETTKKVNEVPLKPLDSEIIAETSIENQSSSAGNVPLESEGEINVREDLIKKLTTSTSNMLVKSEEKAKSLFEDTFSKTTSTISDFKNPLDKPGIILQQTVTETMHKFEPTVKNKVKSLNENVVKLEENIEESASKFFDKNFKTGEETVDSIESSITEDSISITKDFKENVGNLTETEKFKNINDLSSNLQDETENIKEKTLSFADEVTKKSGSLTKDAKLVIVEKADLILDKTSKIASSAEETLKQVLKEPETQGKADLNKTESSSEELIKTLSDETQFASEILKDKVKIESRAFQTASKLENTSSIAKAGSVFEEKKDDCGFAAPDSSEIFNTITDKKLSDINKDTSDSSQKIGEKCDLKYHEKKGLTKDALSQAKEQAGLAANLISGTVSELLDHTTTNSGKECEDENVGPPCDDNKLYIKNKLKTPVKKLKEDCTTKSMTEIDTENRKSKDETLNNILIDMLIEEESRSTPIDVSFQQTTTPLQTSDSESSVLPEKHDIEDSEKPVKKVSLSGFKTAASYGEIESFLCEGDILSDLLKDSKTEQHSYVTTPTMERRKIGGSQRLSREERPALREVSHNFDYSSSDDELTNQYTVTEPVEKKITFQVESEDEAYLKVSDYNSDPEVEVTELSSSPIMVKKKQIDSTLDEKTKQCPDQTKAKSEIDTNFQKVDRRFERMASETMEADPVVKYIADREFQRMVSQLSSEEVDACLNQWDEEGLTPSEELDSTKDTLEGDLDPELEALPEALWASTNPFSPPHMQWVEFEQDLNNVPPSLFWAFDTSPSSAVIQPNDLDIPVRVLGNQFTDQPQTNLNSLNSLETDSSLRINTLVRSPCALTESPLGRPGEESRQLTDETGPTGADISPSKPCPSSTFDISSESPDLPTSEDVPDYSTRKKFWEQISSSSQESQRSQDKATPPVPKPRSSIVSSVPLLKSEAESDTETTVTTLSDSTVRIKSLQQDAVSKQSFTGSSDASDKEEGSETDAVDKEKVLSSVPTTSESVVSNTTEEPRIKKPLIAAGSSDSEADYISKVGEEMLAYENTGFIPDDDNSTSKTGQTAARKTIYERSVSLPTENITDVSESSVKARKRFFENQIKKEMVVDQLMMQLEEEASPEHKSFLHRTHSLTTSDPETMVCRQIHSHIFSHELEEQIESLVPENKHISEESQEAGKGTPTTIKEVESTFSKEDARKVVKRTDSVVHEAEIVTVQEFDYSSPQKSFKDIKNAYEIKIQTPQKSLDDFEYSEQTKNFNEFREMNVLDSVHQLSEIKKCRSDSISKPSDSLEVHIDKSEIEESEKAIELDEEINYLEANSVGDINRTFDEIEEDKIPEITITHSGKQRPDSFSQGESEDTQSESDITPEDLRDKEALSKLQDWDQEIIVHHVENKIQKETSAEISSVIISPQVHTPEEHLPDTVWEVPIQQQSEISGQETVEDIPIERQPIVEKDEEESQRSLTESCEMKSDTVKSDHHESVDTELSLTESALEFKGIQSADVLKKGQFTEEEAREAAKEIVNHIEGELSRRSELLSEIGDSTPTPVTVAHLHDEQVSDYIKKLTGKEDIEVKLIESVLAKKQREQILKLSRADTTSSVEITDEDLRSSGVETDNSPIESQGYRLCPVEDKSEDDITEDILKHEKDLEHDFDKVKEKEVLEKTLAEVKESLEAAQDELIEEKKKKKEDLKKQSPSEFEFKVLTLEKYADEYIQESLVEEAGITMENKAKHDDKISSISTEANLKEIKKKKQENQSHAIDEIKYLKEDGQENVSNISQVDIEQKQLLQSNIEVNENVLLRTDKNETKSSQRGSASFSDDEEKSSHSKISLNIVSTSDSLLSETLSEEKEKEFLRSEQSFTFDDIKEQKTEEQYSLKEEHLKENKKTEELEEIFATEESSSLVTDDGNFKTETTTHHRHVSAKSIIQSKEESHKESKILSHTYYDVCPNESGQSYSEGVVQLESVESDDETGIVIKVIKKEEIKRTYSGESQKSSQDESVKSPTGLDGISSSSSSGRKGDSDTMHSLERPDVVMRKHKTGSSSSQRRSDRRSGAEYEPYSSSGESYYHSFEQTSESMKTPSRPCSSDVELLVAGIATTGSSEYESAISLEASARTFTSHEYHTAVSSLSSRESMKSLDSESSGNLASVEISSDASETLIPSAMELESDMDGSAIPIMDEESYMKHRQLILEPYERDIPHHIIKGESPPRIPSLSDTRDFDRSISLDISSEGGASEEDLDASGASKEVGAVDSSSRMKRSHEMTFQPEPRSITTEEYFQDTIPQEEKYASSLDDSASVLSSSMSINTVIERSRTESERMDGSATSDQLSLTVSGTSEQLSLSSESREDVSVQQTAKHETVATQSSVIDNQIDSVLLMTSSINADGMQSVCTQITSQSGKTLSKSDELSEEGYSCSNGPTQVEYNAEYDIVKEVKKRPGHRRNESTTFKPSAIPVLKKRLDSEDILKKGDIGISEDLAESDKYTDSKELTSKECQNIEKKDVDEAEKADDESYHTEADQGFHRDMREARQVIEVMSSIEDEHEELLGYEESRPQSQISKSDSESGYRHMSSGFSDDRPDSELAELLKQCSSDAFTEDPIERPKTPEPSDECEIKDDTPEFSSEAQASVTELEMEYSGAYSRTMEYESHVSPIREKVGLLWDHDSSDHEEELAEAEAAFQMVPHVIPLISGALHPDTILEDPAAEKHELETRERDIKEQRQRRAAQKEATSPGSIPDITVTQHMTPLVDSGFHYPDLELEETIAKESTPQTPASSRASSETETDQGREYVLKDPKSSACITEEPDVDDASVTTEENAILKPKEKVQKRATDSPDSDSFEMLETPDIVDDFVIIEEVGKEAHEQDQEGKSVVITKKRIVKKVDDTDEDIIVSPPAPVTRMTDLKYYPSGEAPFPFDSDSPPTNVEGIQSSDTTSQEGSPPSDNEQYESEVEAGKKWIEMQFQGDQAMAVYGYEIDYDRGPLEDIKEEDATDLENSSSKFGSLGSQVSRSAGSLGSMKESFSSTPDYDVLAGRKYFTRSGDHDDVSMSSLQEFERLENLIAMEINKNRSSGSQDSLNSSGKSNRHTGSGKSAGDDVSLASLKEFEGLEHACVEAARIELKAKEEEALLSEIEEGHESQASESESCETISAVIKGGDSDEDDYEKRMFEIDEIIRQAQTNVERFIDTKEKDSLTESSVIEKTESMGRGDSVEEVSKIPDLDLDQPLYPLTSASVSSFVSRNVTSVRHWKDVEDDARTSTDSLEMKHGSRPLHPDTLTTSTDSLEVKNPSEKDLMSVSTDSIECQAQQKKVKPKDIMTDSIEVLGDKTSMLTSTDSLETDIPKHFSDSIDEEDGVLLCGPQDQSSSSGKGDLSSGREDSCEHLRMPPPRSELLMGSTDSLEPTSSTATHATYQFENDSVMSSSFTSVESNTLMSSNEALDAGARAAAWFDDSKPYVTEIIEPDTEGGFTHIIRRSVEMPPEIHNVTFKGPDADKALKDYIEQFAPGEEVIETEEVDNAGNVHTTRVVQRRVIMKPDEFARHTTRLTEDELDEYLKKYSEDEDQSGDSQTAPHPSSTTVTCQTMHSTPRKGLTTTHVKGESAGEGTSKSPVPLTEKGSKPPLKYDISVDEDPEFDPREHDWRFNLPAHPEGEEALMDLTSVLQDSKGSSFSGPSGSK